MIYFDSKNFAPLEDWEQAEELVNELTEDFAMSE